MLPDVAFQIVEAFRAEAMHMTQIGYWHNGFRFSEDLDGLALARSCTLHGEFSFGYSAR